MRTLFSVLLLFVGFTAQSQIEIHDTLGNVIVSPVVVTVDEASNVEKIFLKYQLVNVSGGDESIYWTRTREAHDPSIYLDEVCDMIMCPPLGDVDFFQRPLSFTIPAGDSSIFQFKVYPGDVPACAIYSYKVYSGLGTLEASFQVKYRFDSQDCFLSSEEQEIDFSTYPNPASNNFNIQMTTNGADVDLMVYNILGETVMNENLFDGLNNINIEMLNNGVYFYSILKSGKAVETKKLIVRK